jgi:hypothetical protein
MNKKRHFFSLMFFLKYTLKIIELVKNNTFYSLRKLVTKFITDGTFMYFKGIKEFYIEIAPDFLAALDLDTESNKELYLQQLKEYIISNKQSIFEKRRYKTSQTLIEKIKKWFILK